MTFQKQQFTITASIGVTVIEEIDSRYEDLISRADACLYKAKDNGRNTVSIGSVLAETA